MNFIKWLGYFALVAAFIWFVFFRPLHSNSAQPVVQNTENTSEQDNDAAIDENTDVQEETALITEQNEEATKQQITPAENTISHSKGINLNAKYLIVVGSFGVKANADRMLRRVKKNEKEGVITYIRGLHRVVAASTDDEPDAENLKNHFTQMLKEQAFILEQ
jgi:cell division septation protein DedD